MPDLSLEADFRVQGYHLVAGVDEAGRGPLAGPVAAAAVILPPELSGDEPWLAAIDDSKRLTAKQTGRIRGTDPRRMHLAWAVELVDRLRNHRPHRYRSGRAPGHVRRRCGVDRPTAGAGRIAPGLGPPITHCPLPYQTSS